MKWVFVVALAGCQGGGFNGVAVGNPTMNARLAETDGVDVSLAKGTLSAAFSPCGRGDPTVVVLGDVNLASAVRFQGPPQASCTLTLGFVDALTVSGQGAGGTLAATFAPFVIEFPLADEDALGLSPFYTVELGPPEWLAAVADDLATGEVHIEIGQPGYDALASSLMGSSALFLDDGDGVAGPDERAAGALSTSRAGDATLFPLDDTGL